MLAKWTGVLCGSLALLSLPAWGASRDVERIAAMEEFQQNRKVAIVVGVEQYASNLGFDSLDYSVDDAELIAQTLKEQGYKVQLLTDSQATRDAILDRIEQVGKTLPEGDGTLIFYFSGHGLAENNTNYLASFGAVVGRLQSSALSLKEVEAEIRKTQAPRAVLFIDACRDPLTIDSKGANPGFIYEKSEGMKVLFATKFGEKSYERDELKQGVFSHFLNQGLRGQAAEADGLITFDSLTRYVQQGTADWTLEHLKTTQLPYTQDLKENFGVLVLGQLNNTPMRTENLHLNNLHSSLDARPPTRLQTPTNLSATQAQHSNNSLRGWNNYLPQSLVEKTKLICGSAARSYKANDKNYPASVIFCDIGNPTPITPIFPNLGEKATWICRTPGEPDVTCSASRNLH